MIALAAIVAVTGATVGLGLYGVRVVRTTSDLFVASRAVTPWWNAAAISGEYLSAASFLGIAGLQMKLGSGALWLPLGFTAGYLALLLFVAAPLRRLGAYTISDFAESRLGSARLRTLSAAIVLGIGGFYLVPQLKGAGLTLARGDGRALLGRGARGRRRGGGQRRGRRHARHHLRAGVPVLAEDVRDRPPGVPAAALPRRAARARRAVRARAAAGARRRPRRRARRADARSPSPRRRATASTASPRRARAGEQRELPAGTVRLPADTAVPVSEGIDAQRGEQWSRPVSDQGPVSPVFVYSLLVATFLGTMGLPHILVRFYTNPDGPAARRTTVRVLGLLALFYAFPVVYGLLGRALLPELYLTGETDSVVLRLPEAAWPGLGGELLGALVAAGAFAAFMSTASGLLVSLAGHRVLRPLARRRGRGERAAAALQRGRARRDRAADRARAAGPRPRHLPARGLGVRARGEHVLPAAAARDLVGGADRARRGGGPGGRLAGVERADLPRPGVGGGQHDGATSCSASRR